MLSRKFSWKNLVKMRRLAGGSETKTHSADRDRIRLVRCSIYVPVCFLLKAEPEARDWSRLFSLGDHSREYQGESGNRDRRKAEKEVFMSGYWQWATSKFFRESFSKFLTSCLSMTSPPPSTLPSNSHNT